MNSKPKQYVIELRDQVDQDRVYMLTERGNWIRAHWGVNEGMWKKFTSPVEANTATFLYQEAWKPQAVTISRREFQ